MLSWEFPPRIVGGIARHVDELSRALARAGVDVDVLTAHHSGAPAREEIAPGPASGTAASWASSAPGAIGRVRVLRAGPPPIRPLDFVGEIHQLGFSLLERLLGEREVDYDLVHAHEWLVAFPARTIKRGLDLPLVATLHATEAGRNRGIHTPMQHYIHSVEWLLTYDAWRVICCSRAMASEVEGALRAPPDKVRVVPNGVDPDRLRCRDSLADLAAFRARWATEKERIVFFVGRLVREKGVEVLIDAIPEVIAAHPEARFVVAGGGGYEHLWERAARAGVGDKAVFAGFVPEEDLPRLYAVADVAVFPSLYEPFGIVALEAMAAGVPVVTSDIGGFREVVRHGETGIHTWANNSHSLAWGINLVLLDGGLADRLRRRAREEVARRYDWDGIAAETLEVYDEVLSEHHQAIQGLPRRARGPRVPAAARRQAPAVGPGVRPRYLTGGGSARRSGAERS